MVIVIIVVVLVVVLVVVIVVVVIVVVVWRKVRGFEKENTSNCFFLMFSCQKL